MVMSKNTTGFEEFVAPVFAILTAILTAILKRPVRD